MSIVHIRTNEDGEEVQFRPDAAASFRRIERQAGREVSVNRTVVPYAVQEELYERRRRGEYPYSVAHPKYSNHVYRADNDGGNAWDTEERGDWLDEHGWIADIEDEPWHREYRPGRDQHINDPDASTSSTQSKEDDMSFAMKVDGDPTRGPVECVVGHRPNPLSQEEFDYYYGGRAYVCNARQYELNLARHARLIPVDAGVFLGKGASPDRPWTLFAPGYMFQYVGPDAAELLDNQPFALARLAGNDRQYDLWAAQATHGRKALRE